MWKSLVCFKLICHYFQTHLHALASSSTHHLHWHYEKPDMSTIRTLLLDAASQRPDSIALRWKADGVWQTWTFADYLEQARKVAEASTKLNIKPGQRVALMMENRAEWITTYLGLACTRIEVVPIDAKLKPREVSHILRDSESCAIFANGKSWPLINEIAPSLPNLKNMIILDGAIKETERVSGKTRYDYEQLLASVAEASTKPDAFFDRHVPVESDVASIVYTSGTTGRPKGAMLTHGNFITQIDAALQYFKVYTWDNFLLVLPLHHAFAFSANFLVPLRAMCESSMVENLRTIPDNMREVSPTILVAVPLLAEKMLNAIMAKLNKNPAAKIMMRIGLSKVIGKKVKSALGGKLRILVCGGAASDPKMLKTYKKFGITAFEGYGLTETAPIIALAPENDIRFGTVGKAIPTCEFRIENPSEEGIGELLVRGPMVMRGYFRNEAATAEVFDGDWFRTGDLGKLDDDGYLTLTGRKKSLIVNREGKNIYPEEVEIVLNTSPYILESVLVGYHVGSDKGERVGAIIVPDMEYIDESFKKKGTGLTDGEIIELCKNEVYRLSKELADYKRPRRIQVRFEQFEKTTTQKIKRYLYTLTNSET